MLTSRHQHQVFKPIVILNPIYVMDNLAGKKRPAYMSRIDQPVFSNAARPVCHRVLWHIEIHIPPFVESRFPF